MTHTAAGRTALGEYGERLAERHLVAQGLIPLDHNWRCDEGEIDLVLRDGDTLVVCEVKTRSDDACGHPLEAVGEVKLERLVRLGERWIEAHGLHPPALRIDVVGVLRPPKGAAVIEHVRGMV